MADVAVLGTVAADVVVRVSRLPLPGEHVSAEGVVWRLGGSSANVACGLAAAGHHVELIGPVGNDTTSEELMAELARRGVGTDRSIRVSKPAPRALILLDNEGERAIVQLDQGSAAEAFPLSEVPDLGGVACVYVESYERFPVSVGDALLVATPPTGDRPSWPADILIGSESQYAIDWLVSPFECCRTVAGPRLRWVIVTRGRRGADAYGAEGHCHVPSRPAEQVDATGAGDAFAAGVIGALLDGRGIEEAMEHGAVRGAAAVEVFQSIPPPL